MNEMESTVTLKKEDVDHVMQRLAYVKQLLEGMYGFFADNPDCAERVYDWFLEHGIPLDDLVNEIEEIGS